MSNNYEQLIADYLAGENVDDRLIQACKNDTKLLNQLKDDVVFSRIIAFTLQTKDDKTFCDEISQQLANVSLITPSGLSTNDTSKRTGLSDTTKNNAAENAAQPKANNRKWQPLFALCASLILAVVFFIGNNKLNHPTAPLAVINKVVAAKNQSIALSEGQTLEAGDFSLSQGYAEMTLNNGVVLLLEAPISLLINTVDRITLLEGNLVARVPEQAIGFTINTPSAEIVDLGTEFGVAVDTNGESQVHVLTGEVKVRSSNKADFEYLIENQARSFNLQEQVAIIDSKPDLFMRALPGKSAEQPDYLHWTFDQQAGTKLDCIGNGINGRCFDAQFKSLSGTATKPTFSQGKFNDSLYFNGTDDWLETSFAGIGGNKPRTVAFWLKIPENFKVENAYGILSWGLSDKLSAWQISPNPQEELGPLGRIRIGTNHGEVIGTTDLTDNQWHHVAIVLFGGEHANLSTHVLIYINGQLEKTSKKSIAKIFTKLNHPKSKPLTMGKNIAFSNPNNKKQHNRFFKGWLDEVYLFDSALDQQQVTQLMQRNQVN